MSHPRCHLVRWPERGVSSRLSITSRPTSQPSGVPSEQGTHESGIYRASLQVSHPCCRLVSRVASRLVSLLAVNQPASRQVSHAVHPLAWSVVELDIRSAAIRAVVWYGGEWVECQPSGEVTGRSTSQPSGVPSSAPTDQSLGQPSYQVSH
jgi:hypothetical protein